MTSLPAHAQAIIDAARGLGAQAGTGALAYASVTSSRRNLDRVFAGIDAIPEAFPGALNAALPAIRVGHADNFATQSAGGRKWAPLKDTTVAERIRLGFGAGPILTRKGDLRAHVLSTPAKIRRTGNGAELRISPDRIVAGVPKFYRLSLGGGGVTARPMLDLAPSAVARMTGDMARYFRTRVTL